MTLCATAVTSFWGEMWYRKQSGKFEKPILVCRQRDNSGCPWSAVQGSLVALSQVIPKMYQVSGTTSAKTKPKSWNEDKHVKAPNCQTENTIANDKTSHGDADVFLDCCHFLWIAVVFTVLLVCSAIQIANIYKWERNGYSVAEWEDQRLLPDSPVSSSGSNMYGCTSPIEQLGASMFLTVVYFHSSEQQRGSRGWVVVSAASADTPPQSQSREKCLCFHHFESLFYILGYVFNHSNLAVTLIKKTQHGCKQTCKQ